jgi:hypothetical protein
MPQKDKPIMTCACAKQRETGVPLKLVLRQNGDWPGFKLHVHSPSLCFLVWGATIKIVLLGKIPVQCTLVLPSMKPYSFSNLLSHKSTFMNMTNDICSWVKCNSMNYVQTHRNMACTMWQCLQTSTKTDL